MSKAVSKIYKENGKEAHSKEKQLVKHKFIGTFDQAEPYMRDNEYVHRGYRINYNDVLSVLKSLFEWHNETVNVWTHLIGIMMFIGSIVYILGPMQTSHFVPEHELTEALVNDALDVGYQKCELVSHQMFIKSRPEHNRCFIDDDFYEHALEYWIEEVEDQSKEYFSSDYVQHWHSLLKQEYPKSSFSELFLLERDPYMELLKELKHYLMLLDMIEIDDIIPEVSIDTISYLSHTISLRIRVQLNSCLEIISNDPDEKLSPEQRTLQKMVTTYQILLSTLYQHFSSLILRISERYNFQIDLELLLNSDDVYDGYTDYETRAEVTVVPLILHMLAAVSCLGFSSFFHLFTCHCYETNSWLNRLDYGGITILIGGSTIPPYIYTFYCGEYWYFGLFYTIVIDSICFIAFVICLIPAFDKPQYRNMRAILFVIVGLASGLPGFHIVYFRDPFALPSSNVFLWALGGAVYISGAFLYAFRFPERYFPGKFCFFGQSHNIWHCFVLGGAIIHFYASLSEYQTRTMFPCLA